MRDGILDPDGNLREFCGELEAGVAAVIDRRVGRCEIFNTRASEVRLEHLVRIEQPAHDAVEAGKIPAQLGVEIEGAREERGERAVFDTADGARIRGARDRAAVQAEFGDVLVAEDLHVAAGKCAVQRGERGQREDEVADRAAADGEDARRLRGDFLRHCYMRFAATSAISLRSPLKRLMCAIHGWPCRRLRA